MKAFETPVVDVKRFDLVDVLTTSGVVDTEAPTTTTFFEEEHYEFMGDLCVSA